MKLSRAGRAASHFIGNQKEAVMNRIGKRISRTGRVIPRVAFLTIVLVLLTVLTAVPASAQATVVTDNVEFAINLAVFVPCAAGGEGEVVFYSGTQHAVFVTVVDSNGAFHTQAHFQSQGIRGEGLTTGDSYQVTGATQASFNGLVGFENTFINNFLVIGPGPGNNLLIHQTFHSTVQPDGRVIVFLDRYEVECK
jgi:hypothetical protein